MPNTTITITIADVSPEKALYLLNALGGQGLAAIGETPTSAPPVVEPAAAEPTEKPKAAKGQRKTSKPNPAVEPANSNAAEAADDSDIPAFLDRRGEAKAEAKQFTRQDLTETFKALHKEKGDAILPKIKELLNEYGASKQSEIRDEDLNAFIEDLRSLA